MKSVSLWIFVVVLALAAGPAAEGQSPTFAGSMFSNSTVEPGNEVHTGVVFQGDLTLNLPRGLYANFWGSTGIAGSGGGQEIDYTLGLVTKIAGVDVDLSAAFFDLRPLGSKGEDVKYFTIRLTRGGFYAAVNRVSTTDDPTRNSGWLSRVGYERTVSHRIAVNAWLMRDSGVFQGDAGLIGRIQVGININKHVMPLARIWIPLSVDDRSFHVTWGARIAF